MLMLFKIDPSYQTIHTNSETWMDGDISRLEYRHSVALFSNPTASQGSVMQKALGWQLLPLSPTAPSITEQVKISQPAYNVRKGIIYF
jgi:hypothetical protein